MFRSETDLHLLLRLLHLQLGAHLLELLALPSLGFSLEACFFFFFAFGFEASFLSVLCGNRSVRVKYGKTSR